MYTLRMLVLWLNFELVHQTIEMNSLFEIEVLTDLWKHSKLFQIVICWLSLWHKRYLLTWKTTSTQDWRQRSKQQFDSISETKLADPFVKFTFLLTILDYCISTKAFILSDFPHPFLGCLHFTVCHPLTPWNFSTGRVFWNLTVSVEDSLVYWIPRRFS